MPSYSTGFWVATTKKPAASGCAVPSIVTWRSCIASSSAACVFGGVRLTSSAMRISVNTGPVNEVEAAGRGVEDVAADDVGGHQVGSELQALEAAAERGGEGAREQRLADPRHALEQRVAACDVDGQQLVDGGVETGEARGEAIAQSARGVGELGRPARGRGRLL